jgi:hypothetical protein
MVTLIIHIPDSQAASIDNISSLVRSAGGRPTIENDDLSITEFEMLKESYQEVLMVKAGLKKGIPASKLWND